MLTDADYLDVAVAKAWPTFAKTDGLRFLSAEARWVVWWVAYCNTDLSGDAIAEHFGMSGVAVYHGIKQVERSPELKRLGQSLIGKLEA